MRASRMALSTLRDNPAEAEIASHRLLMRAGFIYKSGAGLYVYGPLAKRTIDKIARIVAQEITVAGGLEVTLPILQERGLWQASGRWEAYQAARTMLTVTDRGGQVFGLAPTAEEVVTDYAKSLVSSHKQLPVCFFQQHTKFRDEIRPRYGLMRVKEFIMMDAYSFHADSESLDETYEAMRQAYLRIFRRCGLEAYAVEADTGDIGGSGSHEFMVAAAVGEDTIVYNEASGYAANVERAATTLPPPVAWDWHHDLRPVATPDTTTIEAVVAFLAEHGYAGLRRCRLIKTLLFVAECGEGQATVAACLRGDRALNEVKLANAVRPRLDPRLGPLATIRPMDADEVRVASGARPGFAGPLASLTVDLCLVDEQVPVDEPMVCGGNADDRHACGFVFARDGRAYESVDLFQVAAGDPDPRGDGVLAERKGIEVGHIFKLGTKYSSALGAEFTGPDGKRAAMIMGCYGIGTSRVAAAAVEQHHDQAGMQWPMAIAPWECVVVPAKGKDPSCRDAAANLYAQLQAHGIEAVLDDRDLGPGVKFKDWELIGIPLTVVCGRGLADGVVEYKDRRTGERADVALDAIVERVVAEVRAGQ